jgi:Helix-turn-helix domain
MHDDDPLHTPDETTKILRAGSPRTLERWRATGTGPDYVKVGRRIAYRHSALERYLQKQTRRPTAEKK